jgi:hypothetical protein
MSTYEVFEALTGEYLGEVDSLQELRLGDGIADDLGRVFRISSMTQTGPARSRLHRVEVIETVELAGLLVSLGLWADSGSSHTASWLDDPRQSSSGFARFIRPSNQTVAREALCS